MKRKEELDGVMDLLSKALDIAEEKKDGHITLFKFSTNWRICIGTPMLPIFDENMLEDLSVFGASKMINTVVSPTLKGALELFNGNSRQVQDKMEIALNEIRIGDRKKTVHESELDTIVGVLNDLNVEYSLYAIAVFNGRGVGEDETTFALHRLQYDDKVILEHAELDIHKFVDDYILSTKFDVADEPKSWEAIRRTNKEGIRRELNESNSATFDATSITYEL